MALDIEFKAVTEAAYAETQFRIQVEELGLRSGSIAGVHDRSAAASRNYTRVADAAARRAREMFQDMMTMEALEQMRGDMLSDIGAAASNLRGQVERDQRRLGELQDKGDKLGILRDLLLTEQFDPLNPDHRALLEDTNVLEIAGVDTIEDFAGLESDDQVRAVDVDLAATNDEITQLIQRIETNLEHLEILTQAEEDLLNGVDPREVQARLEAAGIDLDGLAGELDADHAFGLSFDVYNNLNLTKEAFLDLSHEEQAQFIVVAQSSENISDQDLQEYRENMSTEASEILERLENEAGTAVISPSGP